MKTEFRFTDLQRAYRFYVQQSALGRACTMETVEPMKSWRVCVFA